MNTTLKGSPVILSRAFVLLGLLLLPVFSLPARAQQARNICTGNESWVPLGGLTGKIIDVAVSKEGLYALHHRTPSPAPSDTDIQISLWDGFVWRTITSFAIYPQSADTSVNTYRLVEYNGSLYLSGDFSSVDNQQGTDGFARWDGTAWRSAKSGWPQEVTGITALKQVRGRLYGVGTTLRSGKAWVMRLDVDVWGTVGPAVWNATGVFDIEQLNGTLYLGGRFTDSAQTQASYLLRYGGNDWVMVGDVHQRLTYITKLAVFNHVLYAIGRNNGSDDLLSLNADTLLGSTGLYSALLSSGTALTTYQGALYIAQGTAITPGDTLFRGISRYRVPGWDSVSNLNAGVDRLIEWRGSLYAVGKFTASCGVPVSGIAMMCNEGNCGTVSGTVYRDDDHDCRWANGEAGLRNQLVRILPGPYHVLTDANGAYRAFLPPGQYQATVRPWNLWEVICPMPSGVHDVTITAGGAPLDGRNFGLYARKPEPALRVSVATGRIRAGRKMQYAIRYVNTGTIASSGMVELALDPRLGFIGAEPAPSTLSQPYFTWRFTGLEPGQDSTIIVTVMPDTNVPVGTMLCADVKVLAGEEGNIGDCHDIDSMCVSVTSSYDPNDITVIPGDRDGGELGPGDSVLTYVVRFQNTGNDTAFKVVVVDTLSEHVDLATLRLGASSHPYTLRIEKHSTLVWTFDEIALPDSTTNEPASHGFLKFMVGLRRDLPIGTEIYNRASIYFDFNAPVITNTVKSVLMWNLSSAPVVPPAGGGAALRLVPNPARDLVRIEGALHAGTWIEVQDMLGQRVLRQRCESDGGAVLDVKALPSGMYLVIAQARDGAAMVKMRLAR